MDNSNRNFSEEQQQVIDDQERIRKSKLPLPLQNRRDHIKEIFSTLNFKTKPTSYTEDYGKLKTTIYLIIH